NSGVGFLLTYDSRDIPANAYRGTYLDFRGMMYTKFLGSDDNSYRLEIDYRQYKTVGKRKVIAWTAQSKNVFGDAMVFRIFGRWHFFHLYCGVDDAKYQNG
ncbi:BamA/TamA family outer membrane protein, partial [Bacteroides cellulosilyticus]